MVFVKVRETYDLCTTKNKMTVIGIHTPHPNIIKRNYPGLLMQCKAYRPVSADVRIACASVQPLDPKGVGTAEGDVAPEDVFNPILYKAISNKGMSQLEARIQHMSVNNYAADVTGDSAFAEVDNVTPEADEFNIYYALLSNTHDWKHANPQSGLSMSNLKPFVYEVVYNIGDSRSQAASGAIESDLVDASGYVDRVYAKGIIGNAREFPFLNCTGYTYAATKSTGWEKAGFQDQSFVCNAEQDVPWLKVLCGCIIVPPSRLHALYYRMIVEWTLEFTALRPISEVMSIGDLNDMGANIRYTNYSYEETKKALTGSSDSIMDNDSCMVSANVDVNKVM